MISTRSITTVLLVLAAVVRGGGQTSQPAPPQTASLALVTTYDDGRATFHLLSEQRRGSFWTPAFNRIESWRLPDGALPVTALQEAWQLSGNDVRVKVSVLRGIAHEQEQPVAEVAVSRGVRVRVSQLRAFGVQPIDLSITAASP